MQGQAVQAHASDVSTDVGTAEKIQISLCYI